MHNGILRYCGFDVLPPFAAHMPGKISPEERTRLLDAYSARLEQLETTPRLVFHPREDYGPDERLLPHVTPRSGFQHRPGTTPGNPDEHRTSDHRRTASLRDHEPHAGSPHAPSEDIPHRRIRPGDSRRRGEGALAPAEPDPDVTSRR